MSISGTVWHTSLPEGSGWSGATNPLTSVSAPGDFSARIDSSRPGAVVPVNDPADSFARSAVVPDAAPDGQPQVARSGQDGDVTGAVLHGHVTHMLDDERRLDTLLARSARGGSMSERDLLRLQALVYGYTQRMEIATRVVDRAASSLRQLLTTQV